MRIVFFGSSNFSTNVLEELLELGQNIVLVVTAPAKRKGRGLVLSPTPVEVFSRERKLPVVAPFDVNERRILDELSREKPDLFIVNEYGKIFKDKILEIPRIFPLNIHPSLLPRYRGPSPINWQVINRENISGVTFHKITSKVDAGPIIYQEKVVLSGDEDALTVHHELSQCACRCLGLVLEKIANNNFQLKEQDESQASYFPKIDKSFSWINWSFTCEEVVGWIRGLLPWPVARSIFRGKVLMIRQARPVLSDFQGLPAEIVEVRKNSFLVKSGSGAVEILKVQLPSKRIMTSQEFICGYKPRPGERLTSP